MGWRCREKQVVGISVCQFCVLRDHTEHPFITLLINPARAVGYLLRIPSFIAGFCRLVRQYVIAGLARHFWHDVCD